MWCPKCYGGMSKKAEMCMHCGFKMKDLEGATNGAVVKARKEGKKDDVLSTTKIPADVSKKKLLLLCIFLGYMGAHNYYVSKFGRAIYATITFVMFLMVSIFYVAQISSWFIDYFNSFFAITYGITLFIWLLDLINIIAKKFKIPVYKDEFSNKE